MLLWMQSVTIYAYSSSYVYQKGYYSSGEDTILKSLLCSHANNDNCFKSVEEDPLRSKCCVIYISVTNFVVDSD